MPAAARSICRPPSTEPVKLMWSTLPEPISRSVAAWESTRLLEQAQRQAGLLERGGEPLADEQRLRGVLEEDRIAGEKRRDDGVDRGEVGVVPRRDDHDEAERLARDIAAEAGLLRRARNGASASSAIATMARVRSSTPPFSPP